MQKFLYALLVVVLVSVAVVSPAYAFNLVYVDSLTVTYSGTWTVGDCRSFGGGAQCLVDTGSGGSTVSYTFTGDTLTLWYVSFSGSAGVDVVLDGGSPVDVGQDSSVSVESSYEFPPMDFAEHTVVVTSRGSYGVFDAFTATPGAPTTTPVPTATSTPSFSSPLPYTPSFGSSSLFSQVCFEPVNPVLAVLSVFIALPVAVAMGIFYLFAGRDGACYPLDSTSGDTLVLTQVVEFMIAFAFMFLFWFIGKEVR